MRQIRWFSVAVLIPSLVLVAFTAGCGDKDKDKDKKTDGGNEKKDNGGEPKTTELKPLESKGRGSVKGSVMVGDPKPNLEELNKTFQQTLNEAKADKDHCLKQEGQNTQQTWIFDDKGNLANVVVWVAPPDGFYFNLEDKDRDVKALGIEEVVIDQPHCAFTPRITSLFPSYYDAKTKKYVQTAQKVVVKNSGTLNHNTTWSGAGIRGDNKTVGPNATLPIEPKQLTASGLKPSADPVMFSCQVHPWMRAYARGLDHPFAAVSNKDGTFEIKNVPAGAELRLMYWHESMKAPKELKKIKVKEGDAVEEKITVGS